VEPGPFITYAREDQPFVRRLHDALMARRRDPWVDWEILPTAEWMAEIRTAIDAAPAVVYVLSPDSVASAVCLEEIAYALEQKKRIIPLVCRTVPAERVPASVRTINWIQLLDHVDLDATVDTLVTAMDADLGWVRAHARLLVRAREWDTKGRNASLLLRGADLKESEEWLVHVGEQEAPRRTELQVRYVVLSSRAETQRRRYLVAGISTALVATTGLAVVALIQSSIARSQRNHALSRLLAAQARHLRLEPRQLAAELRQPAFRRAAALDVRLQRRHLRVLRVDVRLRALRVPVPERARGDQADDRERADLAVPGHLAEGQIDCHCSRSCVIGSSWERFNVRAARRRGRPPRLQRPRPVPSAPTAPSRRT
jgi:hypothetical protein